VRVILQAENGRRAGHRVWLGANQRLCVGGTEWAEFAIHGDQQIADVQFLIDCDFHSCRIRNLCQAKAVLVNGSQVIERTLVDGDIVSG